MPPQRHGAKLVTALRGGRRRAAVILCRRGRLAAAILRRRGRLAAAILRRRGGRAAGILRHGGLRYACPICRGRFRHFLAAPNGRANARCPRCGSLERHRRIWLYLRARTELFDRPTRLLHLAPEPCLAQRLRASRTVDYLSGDLTPGVGMVTLDLTALHFPDASFDAALCLHVLEHVADDEAAMSELHRVVRPGGWCLVEVPLRGEETLEAWPGISREERERNFYQSDHERLYGRGDLAKRLEAVGFEVEVDVFRDAIAPELRRRYRLAFDLGPAIADSDEPWITFRCSR